MNSDEVSLAWRAFNLNWLPVALLCAVLFGITVCTDFSLEPTAFGVAIAIAVGLAFIAYGSALMKPDSADPKLVFWFGTTAQIIVVTAVVGPLSYVANAVNWPLQDHTLLLIDRAIGADPRSIAAFFNDHSRLANYLKIGYSFIKWPLLGIPIILTIGLRFNRLQQFVLALSLALAVTIVISAFVPAVGTYYGLGLSPAERFPLLDSSNYAAQLRDIQALRDGSLRHLDLLSLAGIVSFPSFHTASAVLYMWALWPIRALRWTTIALNAWMIAATPLIGAHYLIDLVGGAVVAAGCVLLTKRLFRSQRPGSSPRQAPRMSWEPAGCSGSVSQQPASRFAVTVPP